MSNKPDNPIQAKLRAIAAAYGHVTPDLEGDSTRFKPAAPSGHLQIVREYHRPDTNQHMCDCLCRCGRKVRQLSYSKVKGGIIRSCGCNEESRKRAQAKTLAARAYARRLRNTARKDWLGAELGYLTVTGYLEHVKDATQFPPGSLPNAQKWPKSGFFWELTCACGTKLYLTASAMRTTKRKHCGGAVCARLWADDYPKKKVMWYINLNFSGQIPRARRTSSGKNPRKHTPSGV